MLCPPRYGGTLPPSTWVKPKRASNSCVEVTVQVLYHHDLKRRAFVAWCPSLHLFVTCATLADLKVAAPAAVRECLARRHKRHLDDARRR